MISWTPLPGWLTDRDTEHALDGKHRVYPLHPPLRPAPSPVISVPGNGHVIHLVGCESSQTLSFPSLPSQDSCSASFTSSMNGSSIHLLFPIPITWSQTPLFFFLFFLFLVWITIGVSNCTPCLQAAPLQSAPHSTFRVLFLSINIHCLPHPSTARSCGGKVHFVYAGHPRFFLIWPLPASPHLLPLPHTHTFAPDLLELSVVP